jgi:hypothetical protein
MVAASPCALAVAPLAYATAISACARKVRPPIIVFNIICGVIFIYCGSFSGNTELGKLVY